MRVQTRAVSGKRAHGRDSSKAEGKSVSGEVGTLEKDQR